MACIVPRTCVCGREIKYEALLKRVTCPKCGPMRPQFLADITEITDPWIPKPSTPNATSDSPPPDSSSQS